GAWDDWQPLLHEEVDRLPQKYRVPVVLCYLEGKTHDEAARQLGWPLGTVKGRLARARDLLRVRLARRGLGLPAGAVAALLTPSAVQAALPDALADSTGKAALRFAAGQAVGAGSARVAALTEGVLQAMTLHKLKVAAVVFLLLGLLATGAGVLACRVLAARPGEEEPGAAQRDQLRPGPGKRAETARQGDPLPPGALARIGTVRFRHGDAVLAAA